MVHEMPSCDFAWTEPHGHLEIFTRAGGLLNTAAVNLELRGQQRPLWHPYESHVRIDWTKTGQSHEFFTR